MTGEGVGTRPDTGAVVGHHIDILKQLHAAHTAPVRDTRGTSGGSTTESSSSILSVSSSARALASLPCELSAVESTMSGYLARRWLSCGL